MPGLEHREAALPKLLIIALRDHAYAKAPYLLAGEDERDGVAAGRLLAEASAPLVGATEG